MLKKMTQDELWKNVIEDLTEEFIAYFLPDLYEIIDFERHYEFLDKELSTLSIESERGKNISDKLIKGKPEGWKGKVGTYTH